MTKPTTSAAPSGTVGAVVGLNHWQRWIDSRPSTDTGYLTLAIRCMIEDLLTLEQAREITTWSLGVERRKANKPPRVNEAAKAAKPYPAPAGSGLLESKGE